MNHITVAGRLVEDTVRKEANSSAVTSFRISSESSGSKSGRLWIHHTWGRLAGTCNQHLVFVRGRVTQKQWAYATTGEKRSRFIVTARDIDYLVSPQA